MAEDQAPAQEAPAAGGGGMSDAITQTSHAVTEISKAVTSNDQLPDEVKQAFGQALSTWQAAVEGLMQVVGGGEEAAEGEAPAPGQPGVTTPEQGGSGAVPMSHQMTRGK